MAKRKTRKEAHAGKHAEAASWQGGRPRGTADGPPARHRPKGESTSKGKSRPGELPSDRQAGADVQTSTTSTSPTVGDVEVVEDRPRPPHCQWDTNEGLFDNCDRLGRLLSSLP